MPFVLHSHRHYTIGRPFAGSVRSLACGRQPRINGRFHRRRAQAGTPNRKQQCVHHPDTPLLTQCHLKNKNPVHLAAAGEICTSKKFLEKACEKLFQAKNNSADFPPFAGTRNKPHHAPLRVAQPGQAGEVLGSNTGAGGGNRTPVSTLEGSHSATKLHPQHRAHPSKKPPSEKGAYEIPKAHGRFL